MARTKGSVYFTLVTADTAGNLNAQEVRGQEELETLSNELASKGVNVLVVKGRVTNALLNTNATSKVANG